MPSRINAFQRMPGRLVQEDDIDALFGRPEIEPDARETGRQVQTLSILLLSESISNAQAKSALACDPCEAIRLDSENVFEAFTAMRSRAALRSPPTCRSFGPC